MGAPFRTSFFRALHGPWPEAGCPHVAGCLPSVRSCCPVDPEAGWRGKGGSRCCLTGRTRHLCCPSVPQHAVFLVQCPHCLLLPFGSDLERGSAWIPCQLIALAPAG